MSQRIRIIRASRAGKIEWLGAILAIEGELAVETEYIWLRFCSPTATSLQSIDSIPGEHFEQDEAKRLRKLGQDVSEMLLPELTWQAIPKAVEFSLPTPALAGELRTDQRVDLALVRSYVEKTPEASLIDFNTLLGWVDRAPEIRLSKLRFLSHHQSGQDTVPVLGNTANANDEVLSSIPDLCLVIGTPLPSVPCRFLCRYNRLLIPSGFRWQPNIHISFIEACFGLNTDQWLLWLNTNHWYILNEQNFAPLTRAAMRSLARSQRSNL